MSDTPRRRPRPSARGRAHRPPEPDAAALFAVFTEIGIIDQLATVEFARVLPHGLTPAQFAVLNHCVRTTDGKTPGALAEILQVTRGTMSSTLARLESKGFIQLVGDATDGRSKRVVLTRSGRAAREASIAATAPLLLELAHQFTVEDARHLLPTLQRLRELLDRRRGGGAAPPDRPHP